MRKLVALSAVLAVCGTTSTAQASNTQQVIESIDSYILATQHRQRVMGVPVTPTVRSYVHTKSHKYRMWVHDYWKKTTNKVHKLYQAPPHRAQWQCIHGYEGSWNANTGNGYYGGLQMDYGFMSTYGSELLAAKGTANNWTPAEQMWVAERAYYSGRGFGPWPNTARYCGLL